jgi:hypothetical protein
LHEQIIQLSLRAGGLQIAYRSLALWRSAVSLSAIS